MFVVKRVVSFMGASDYEEAGWCFQGTVNVLPLHPALTLYKG